MNPRAIGWVVSAYRAIALLLLNTLLIFVLLNLGLGVLFYLRDGPHRPVGSLWYPTASLAQVYPHMREQEWRAMLNESWALPLEFEAFTHFKEMAKKGEYVNVSKNGFRMHKRQGTWPLDPHAFNIFFFGGSTAFGYGVRDDETIPSVLQDLLSQETCAAPVYVYNFGRGGYYSSQEGILLARLLVGGFTPQLAIFLDGINERLDGPDQPSLTDEFKAILGPQFFGGKPKWVVSLDMHVDMPLLRAARIAKVRLERFLARNYPRDSDAGKQPERAAQDRPVLTKYLRNMALVDAMAGRLGAETLFIWQPSPTYGYDLRYHLFPPSKEEIEIQRYAYSEVNQLRAKLPAREQARMLWLGDLQKDKKEPLYVDRYHYTATFSREIAGGIAQALVSREMFCRQHDSVSQRS